MARLQLQETISLQFQARDFAFEFLLLPQIILKLKYFPLKMMKRTKIHLIINLLLLCFQANANFHLTQAGKQTIRSSSTIWNFSKPKCKTSIQARNHRGKGLWCTRKPPKAEERENNDILMRSMDDKAYLRPGTGEAMDRTRNGRILRPTADSHARVLPIHDFPEKKVCVTPSSHRVFTKSGQIIDEKEVFKMSSDRHFVFVRPKYFVGSSGIV